jgi:hypothetical protein
MMIAPRALFPPTDEDLHRDLEDRKLATEAASSRIRDSIFLR